MSKPIDLQRGTVIAISGIAAAVACYIAYQRYQSTSTSSIRHSLHRSNAVRRRPRWRRGFPRQDLDHLPTDRALEHLQQREESREGYGRYMNAWVVDGPLHETHGNDFNLLPSNFSFIFTTITEWRRLNAYEQEQLDFHIQALFVQNFLHEEFPSGYIIGEDVHRLISGISPRVDSDLLQRFVTAFDHGEPTMSSYLEFQREPNPHPTPVPFSPTEDTDYATVDNITQALGGNLDDDYQRPMRRSLHNQPEDESGQNVLDLLYRIGEEQAKRNGYLHRGVECNGCAQHPIEGIRYHCANCWDYDLCETCEAQQIHNKSHVFYKIRIPAPTRGQIKRVQPKWYPGNPNACPDSIPRDLRESLLRDTQMDRPDIDALYDQYRCIAGRGWADDPSGVGMAIDRRSFDMYFTSTGADRGPPQNLIYDRIFAFYDRNSDGLISFEEFVKGSADLLYNSTRHYRLSRLFAGFDLDGDGYVCRKDFLRILRAHYALSKELTHEMIYARDDAVLAEEEIRDAIHGSHPISAAFGGSSFPSNLSRGGQDKRVDTNGDLQLINDVNNVLREDTDMTGNRVRAIGNAAVGHTPRPHPFRSFREEAATDEPILLANDTGESQIFLSNSDDFTEQEINRPDASLQIYGWPPLYAPESEDIIEALGVDVPVEEIMDPVDRSRVVYAQTQRMEEESDRLLEQQRKGAVNERWRRRQFYTDEEEGMGKPPGYTEPDSSDDDVPEDVEPLAGALKSKGSSRRASLRSRSSSKVRFDDSAIDTDYETRSDVSSRSIPVNERWGGFELSEPEKDIGRDIIYQTVQQGFNELLDPIFKQKEDEAMEALATQASREKWATELQRYEETQKPKSSDKHETLETTDQSRREKSLGRSTSTELKVESDPDEEDHIGMMFGGHAKGSSESLPDPTLPQNRPNEILTRSESDNEEPEPPPLESTLAVWVKHKAIDEEARERGGYGRLNFQELRRKMRAEMDHHMKEEESEDDDQYWETSADLGKLSFLSSWLEMGQF